METAWVLKGNQGKYKPSLGFSTESLSHAEVFPHEEDADYRCPDNFFPVEIVIMEKSEFEDIINMRTVCSVCGEQLDTKIINGIRRIEPCQRGCRG